MATRIEEPGACENGPDCPHCATLGAAIEECRVARERLADAQARALAAARVVDARHHISRPIPLNPRKARLTP